MAFVKPEQVVENMISAGEAKAKLSIRDMLIRGILAGALLGFGTTLAFTAELQSQMGIIGALLFPAGFVIIIILGLELVTGNFAIIPVAVLEGKATITQMLSNWFWVIIGHLIGCAFYALLYVITATQFGHVTDNAVAEKLIGVAEAKTLGYANLGSAGLVVVFVKAILCNWMVTLGAVMAMTSQSTLGKIAAMWLPILIFFAQGFEHAVVNMFVIPAGMMLGADITMADWWLWNQIPVTLGNILSGFLFTGLALYLTHQQTEPKQAVVKMSKSKSPITSTQRG
jgi:formate/nitrite transporter